MIEAKLLKEVVESDARDTHAEGGINEIDEVGAAGVGMGEAEFEDGSGIARQKLAVGAAIHAVVSLLHGLLGGHALLPGGSGTADAEQAGECRDLEAAMAMEQKMREQACGVGVVALLLAEALDGQQNAALVGGEAAFADLGLRKPSGESIGSVYHRSPSQATSQGVVYSVAAKG